MSLHRERVRTSIEVSAVSSVGDEVRLILIRMIGLAHGLIAQTGTDCANRA